MLAYFNQTKLEIFQDYCFLPLFIERYKSDYLFKKRKLLNCLKIAVDELNSIMLTSNLEYTCKEKDNQ